MEMQVKFTSNGAAHDVVGNFDYVNIQNLTTGKTYQWTKGMDDGKAIDVSEGTIIASNGVTKFRKKSFTKVKGKITAITKAAQAVVTFEAMPDYKIGSLLLFNVPAEYGMKEINGLRGKVVAVNSGAKTATVDIDTRTFTTFAVPETPKTIAETILVGVVPGCDGLCGTNAPMGTETTGITLGTSVVGASGDIIVVQGSTAMEACEC